MPMSEYYRSLRARIGRDLIEIPSVALAVRDRDGRVLLGLNHEDGRWLLPGGAVEPLEEPAAAAVREAREETGLEVEIVRLVGVYGGPLCRVTYANGDAIAFVATLFEARATGGAEQPDDEELSALRWVGADDWQVLSLAEWAPAMLRDVFAARSEAGFASP